MYEQIKVDALKSEISKNINKSNFDLTDLFKYYVDRDNKKFKMVFQQYDQIGIGVEDNAKDEDNMQSDGACFEGWAAVLYTYGLEKEGTIFLDEGIDGFDPDKVKDPEYIYQNPHYGRFLYRALRFSEQYEWFKLEGKLKKAVDNFKKYLDSHIFMNNVPADECHISSKDKPDSENAIEMKFAETANGMEKLINLLELKKIGEVHRQLPVGLFDKNKSSAPHSKKESEQVNSVFPGGKAAIDLWTISGDTFYMLELKNAKNKKVGAITEMFFYSNYIYDLFVKSQTNPHFAVREERKKNDDNKLALKDYRGYGELLDKSKSKTIKNVKGFLLLDNNGVHPLITKDVLKVLNDNNVSGISYGDHVLKYNFDEIK